VATELVRVGTGRAFTVLVIPAEVAVHPRALVTITSTICPFVRVVVVKVARTPFWMLTPATLKL
jgi:hypothetical protein